MPFFSFKQLNANTETPLDVKDFIDSWKNEQESFTAKTSGSTGTPKEITIRKQAAKNSALATGKFFNLQKGQTALLCLSPNFIAGKMMIVRSILHEMNLLVTDVSSHPIKNLNQSIDFAAMVPLQVEKILDESPEKFSFIKNLIIGGAPVSTLLEKKLQLIPTKCFATFGMTETISHIALKPLNGLNDPYTLLPQTSISCDSRSCLIIEAPLISKSSKSEIIKSFFLPSIKSTILLCKTSSFKLIIRSLADKTEAIFFSISSGNNFIPPEFITLS